MPWQKIELTTEGRRLVDRVLPEDVANEREMLSVLSEREREQLSRLMRKLLAGLEAG